MSTRLNTRPDLTQSVRSSQVYNALTTHMNGHDGLRGDDKVGAPLAHRTFVIRFAALCAQYLMLAPEQMMSYSTSGECNVRSHVRIMLGIEAGLIYFSNPYPYPYLILSGGGIGSPKDLPTKRHACSTIPCPACVESILCNVRYLSC
jgi:hypothetical protein